jgi:hypothetical protein
MVGADAPSIEKGMEFRIAQFDTEERKRFPRCHCSLSWLGESETSLLSC